MDDEQFLSYVLAHSQTKRALFSHEHVERLYALADLPFDESLFIPFTMLGPVGNLKPFLFLHKDLAAALVRRVRIKSSN